jgi:hypothetical protein
MVSDFTKLPLPQRGTEVVFKGVPVIVIPASNYYYFSAVGG